MAMRGQRATLRLGYYFERFLRTPGPLDAHTLTRLQRLLEQYWYDPRTAAELIARIKSQTTSSPESEEDIA